MTGKTETETETAASTMVGSKTHPLDVFFAPATVAVIGATEAPGSVGRTLVSNLRSARFGGTVFPVNPRRDSVLGLKAHRSIAAVPERVDLAVIATPAATVPVVVRECADAGVRGAVIVSAGFRECGSSGAELEGRILAEARRGKMRIVGPNCLGIMSPGIGLNATFASTLARPGNVAFLSQSGALCTAVLGWSLKQLVGFSAFVSLGSMLDVGWGDLIEYLGDDPKTRSILIYMESIGDTRAFLSAAREVALSKPIIVLKAGRSEAAAAAAVSHTGALVGSDEVLDAAFRRSGVLRVENIADLFYMAEVLARQPRPPGPHLAILTNAGGPGVLATDALIRAGGQLASLQPRTVEALDRVLPAHWSRRNPVDILGDAGPERYRQAFETIVGDPGVDGLLVILTPQAMTDPTGTAAMFEESRRSDTKPVIASWMGGNEIAAGEEILNRAGVPTFPYPDTAARAFQYMCRYSSNLKTLYETPTHAAAAEPSRNQATVIVEGARVEGRTILTEFESKQILAAYGIATPDTRLAATVERAVACAETIGYPVVLKLHSLTVTHKAEVGGVRLDLRDASAVREAFAAIERAVTATAGVGAFQGVTVQPMVPPGGYELILGSSVDPQFGPVLVFGAGGGLVEVLRDRALSLPPLNTTLARRLMEQTRIYAALGGGPRRPAVDLDALAALLVRFSHLVVEQRWIREIDINPLRASADGMTALDARTVLHEPSVTEDSLPRLAIRPYPSRYVAPWRTRDGIELEIRPIRPEDEPLMVRLHERLSERSVYFRYFHNIRLSRRIAHERLVRMCFIDYDREMALVVERREPGASESEIVAVGRLIKQHGTSEAEFALLVRDDWQGRGLGRELLRRLVEVGRDEKLDRITGDILSDNSSMQHICERLGFKLHYSTEERAFKGVLQLSRSKN